MTTKQAEIHSVVEKMTNAFHAKDINGIMEAYEGGASVVFEPNAPVTDFEALKEKFQQAFAIDPNFTYPKGYEVFFANDIAMHIAPWEMSGQTPDGQEINQSGLSIAVLRRQTDGSWKMVLDNPNGHFLLSN